MNVRYYGQWKDLAKNNHRIEILTGDAVSSPQEILMTLFKTDNPSNELLGESRAFGSGADLNFISPTRLAYLGSLYTNDFKKYMVKHYINGSINWMGWLDPEQYNDPISRQINYEVGYSANNGIRVLDRINIDGGGGVLSGVDTVFNVIKRCIAFMDLPLTKIHVGLSTTAGTLAAGETILHTLYANYGNYYDERGEPKTCREVLDTILLPLSAFLTIYGDAVYILDVDTISSDVVSVKTYGMPNGEYLTAGNITNHTQITEMLDGSESVTMRSGANAVELTLSKYSVKNPLSLGTDSPTGYINSAVFNTTINDEAYTYEEKRYAQCPGFVNLYPDNVQFVKREEKINTKGTDAFIRFTNFPSSVITANGGSSPWALKIVPGVVLTSSKYFLKFSADYRIEKLGEYEKGGEFGVTSGQESGYGFGVSLQVRVGESYYQGPPTPYAGDSSMGNGSGLASTWSKAIDGEYNGTAYTYTPWIFAGISKLKATGIINGRVTYNKWWDYDTFSEVWRTKFVQLNPNYPGNDQYGLPLAKYWSEQIDISQYGQAWPLAPDFFYKDCCVESQQEFALTSCTGGELEILVRFPQLDGGGAFTTNLKNIKLSVFKMDEYNQLVEVENGDTEITGYLDAKFKDNKEIKIHHGSDANNFSRAAFLVKVSGTYSDSAFATNARLTSAVTFTRNGSTGLLEELLLNTLLSNYNESRYELSAKVRGYFPPFQTFTMGLLKKGELASRLFRVKSTTDYMTGFSEDTYVEFVPSNLTIIK